MISVNRFFKAAVLFLLLTAALVFSSVSSFADFRPDSSFVAVANAATGLDMAAGAVLDGALSGLSVDLAFSSGVLLTTYDLIQSIIYGNPLGVLPDYTYNQPLSEILSQETIKIRSGSVTIDGVEYSDVWLPHDAANKFRVNAFDFITHYNILSESSGTYVSGVGYLNGIPVFSSNGVLRTQSIVLPKNESSTSPIVTSLGDLFFFCRGNFNSPFVNTNYGYRTLNSQIYQFQTPAGGSPIIYFQRSSSSSSYWYAYGYRYASSSLSADSDPFYGASYSQQSFDFTWLSGSIPSEPLPSEQGLRFRVPSSYVSSLPSTISPDLADYVTLINDLTNALQQARLADAVESTAFEEYDSPVPSTGTIAEEPYSSLDGSLSGIQDSLDNIDTNIGTVDESLDDIQVYAEDAADSLQSIDTNLSQSVSDTAGIKGFIHTYLPGIHSFLNGISTSVSNIAGSVAAADETFFGNVVDAILAPFTPVFDVFKSGVGIWRYVVAWVGNISAPFAWIWNILSQSNGILVSPILASAAAAVVLAVYKKFGR